ncbi:metabolite traffic protein EboE [Actinopolyspora saharensis]|uniref:metabolite traffic protein EboE n=1 Tax=Actinopolyspora saharensis TaxID=995062 RepID=UPI003F66B9BB
MRFLHRDGSVVHLAYCTNVHPAEDLDGIIAQLDRYAVPIRERLGADRLGLGLWLPREVARLLTESTAALEELRRALTRRHLEVVTLNGFPYGGFHDPVVKHAVYRPDWSERSRLEYTLELARVLVELLPADVTEGSVSTLPLGLRDTWAEHARSAASGHLAELSAGLAELARRTGRSVRVGFEPEPGCVLETTDDAVSLLRGIDPARIGVCLDACHLAVAFERPSRALAELRAAGIPVVKTQASCALHAQEPCSPATRRALESFTEPRFLHQTRAAADGALRGVDDLDRALAGELADGGPWRVHFHTPLHTAPRHPLTSTREVLIDALAELLAGGHARTSHVEVETYTWDVLPERDRQAGGVVPGTAAELAWTRARLLELGLTEIER